MQSQGYITYILTDIEGSSRLWEQWPDQMRKAHARQLQIIADAISANNGTLALERGEGDSTFSWFLDAHDAVRARGLM